MTGVLPKPGRRDWRVALWFPAYTGNSWIPVFTGMTELGAGEIDSPRVGLLTTWSLWEDVRGNLFYPAQNAGFPRDLCPVGFLRPEPSPGAAVVFRQNLIVQSVGLNVWRRSTVLGKYKQGR